MAWPGLEESSSDVCEDLRVARKMKKDAFQGIPWEAHRSKADSIPSGRRETARKQSSHVGCRAIQ